MPLGDRFRDIDRQEFRLAAIAGRCCDGIGRDLAVQRTDRHEGIQRCIARHFADLIGTELNGLNLVGRDAGLAQNHLEQDDVGLGFSDHADAVSCEVVETLYF